MNAHHEMSHEEIARTRLEVLRREHRDLDEAITALASGDMDGKAGTTLMLRNVPALDSERLLLVGLGKEKEFRDKAYGAAIRSAAAAASG